MAENGRVQSYVGRRAVIRGDCGRVTVGTETTVLEDAVVGGIMERQGEGAEVKVLTIVGPYSVVGKGVVVEASAIVGSNVLLGDGCVVVCD